jgi:hypothetical protein
LFSALCDPEVSVLGGLSEIRIPNSKGDVVPTVFNAEKVMEEGELSEPAAVWQPKIVGRPDPVTPPMAKRGRRGGKQQKTVLRESDSDFEAGEAVVKEKGGWRKLILDSRSCSQPVLYPFMSIYITSLTCFGADFVQGPASASTSSHPVRCTAFCHATCKHIDTDACRPGDR